MYADDTHLYVACDPAHHHETLKMLETAISEIRQWMIANHLKLNDSKTEFMVMRKPSLRKNIEDITSICIGDTAVNAVNHAKNIGATLDTEMTMTGHIKNTIKSCYSQIRLISHIRACISQSATETLVNSLVTSRLDYVNALLYGVSNDKLRKLQSVQHSAARLIFKKKKSEHVTPLLRSLHWLPVEHRINYKINLLTFKAIHGEAPLYLQELVQPYQPARHLRSMTQEQLTRKDTAKTGKRTGGRAFSVSAVLLWNNLSPNVKTHVKLESFKKALKTFYFEKCFSKA